MATLHPRMFIAQKTLETWMDSGNVDVTEDRVHLGNVGRSYLLEPAVRFVGSITEGSSHELLGKVLTEARIQRLGGELMGDSVLFGEAAFEVEPGFVGTLEVAKGG